MKLTRLWILCVACLLVGTCANRDNGTPPVNMTDGGIKIGVETCASDPAVLNADEDGDGIPNGEESCLTGRDSDNDQYSDWKDPDSDNDKVLDSIEAGLKDSQGKCASTKAPKNGWPCDTDGDGFPDYIDLDSDNDKLEDGNEDVNGDGVLGCCIKTCNKPAERQKTDCSTFLTEEGCGPGQTCKSGLCTPAVGISCSNGETSPFLKDTFNDGKLDNERNNFICRDATTQNTTGRKEIKLQKNKTGDWHVALEMNAAYQEILIQDPTPKMAAAAIDHTDPKEMVAGFVISLDTDKADVNDAVNDLITRIMGTPPGGTEGTVNIRTTGASIKTHDRFDSVQGTMLDLNTNSDISTVRNELISVILGRQVAKTPAEFGGIHQDMVIRFITVKRFNFKRDDKNNLIKDAKGFPVDDGDTSKWRLIVMGAVVADDEYTDTDLRTGFIADDLSNGTSLASYDDGISNDCDVKKIEKLAVADIIWVIDESGSMDLDRENVVKNATDFFARAQKSGLDFRMGITGVSDPKTVPAPLVGKFCSETTDTDDGDGGPDRFLKSEEMDAFGKCIKNPPGNEEGNEYGLTNGLQAIKNHLPRGYEDNKIRPNAQLVVIFAGDETTNELQKSPGFKYKECIQDAAGKKIITDVIQPMLDVVNLEAEGSVLFHSIGCECSTSAKCCGGTVTASGDISHGFIELVQMTGGQRADICQQDLGNTLQVIIDSIVAASSPAELKFVPISASLAISLDKKVVPRGRSEGFDYRNSSNSLAFIGQNFQPRKGSEFAASYKRWSKQAAIK